VLNTGIVDEDINSTEFFGGLFNQILSISGFGEVSKNELGFDVIAGDLGGDVVNLILRGKSVENDVSTSG
jgi:hypothetical protein